ncbi:hypothetical protein F751_2192 [Auxenochlorella protothecoides]|uniref:Uncharacterized protein n=1 Tax=Auxenochlorella protothecoides TaxID=3075 RepID=A0A087SLK1_AUXPR|nr:hypothetical protein F751_2192 [Auxenochlorella protothecoides]KFM26605.1 hypothetical protein F751_2192 [Auxenochlorella protothecoides]
MGAAASRAPGRRRCGPAPSPAAPWRSRRRCGSRPARQRPLRGQPPRAPPPGCIFLRGGVESGAEMCGCMCVHEGAHAPAQVHDGVSSNGAHSFYTVHQLVVLSLPSTIRAPITPPSHLAPHRGMPHPFPHLHSSATVGTGPNPGASAPGPTRAEASGNT